MALLPLLSLLSCNFIFCFFISSSIFCSQPTAAAAAPSLQKFVDELPFLPSIKGYRYVNATFMPATLTIGMYKTTWSFHRDLPPTVVYAYGTSTETASVPGPTIEALGGIDTYVRWENNLPLCKHIFKVDSTLDSANPKHGIPTVVHLHGGLTEPESDGHAFSWFTTNFEYKGPTWKKEVYHYRNSKHHSNLWYHDHAMGLTRLNMLAGLLGAYIIRNPKVEIPFQLPTGMKYDRPLFVFDRSFNRDGSIYTNPEGNNPTIHPEWQPEYFGDTMIVNGKAWPFLKVRRRKYRFRIINASNARFFRFALDNGLTFTQIGSDAFYFQTPVVLKAILLAPSEIADVIIDFNNSSTREVHLKNNATYPFPDGDSVNEMTGKVMKFIVDRKVHKKDPSRIPLNLVPLRRLDRREAVVTRYVTLYEFNSNIGEPERLLINFLPFTAPVTETPKQGTTELWQIINLTDDNHPFHLHLVGFQVESELQLNDTDALSNCMEHLRDAEKCNVWKHAIDEPRNRPPPNEAGWKNVYKMQPSHLTSILIPFSQIDSKPFPFNASTEPGYIYHCHILEHEDNKMMRPFVILP